MSVRKRKALDVKLENISWLFYGASGAGKTTLAGTFPGPIAHINMANANEALTLRGHPGVDIFDIETVEDVNDTLIYLEKHSKDYKTVVFDNMTSFVELLYNTQASKGGVEQRHYMQWGSQILRMADRLRPLPMEKIYIAALRAVRDEVGVGKHGGPAMFTWLEQRFPLKMDAIVYMEASTDFKGVVTISAHLSGSGPMIGRVRGTLPGGIVANPGYAAIIERLAVPLFQGDNHPAQQHEPETAVASANPEEGA